MAHVIELTESRGGTNALDSRDRKLVFLIALEDGENEADAVDACLEEKPDTYEGMAFRSMTIDPEPNAVGIFKITLNYGSRTTTVTIDSSPGSERRYCSIETIARFGLAGEAAADFQGGINVSKSSVEGVDVLADKQTLTVVKQWGADEIDGAYLDELDRLKNKVNDAEIVLKINGVDRTYAEGELRFDGHRVVKQSQDGDWEISYTLSVSRGEDDIIVAGGTIGSEQDEDDNWVIPHKDGWDYLWIHFAEQLDSATNTLVRVADSAYIERVYPRVDFMPIGIFEEPEEGGP